MRYDAEILNEFRRIIDALRQKKMTRQEALRRLREIGGEIELDPEQIIEDLRTRAPENQRELARELTDLLAGTTQARLRDRKIFVQKSSNGLIAIMVIYGEGTTTEHYVFQVDDRGNGTLVWTDIRTAAIINKMSWPRRNVGAKGRSGVAYICQRSGVPRPRGFTAPDCALIVVGAIEAIRSKDITFAPQSATVNDVDGVPAPRTGPASLGATRRKSDEYSSSEVARSGC